MTRAKRWRAKAGTRPAVVIEERKGRPNLWLRWRDAAKQNWAWEPTSLVLRDARGAVIAAVRDEAMAVVEAKRRELTEGGKPAAPDPVGLRLLEGLAEAVDPDTGLYPMDTSHRREVSRSVEYAADVLGHAVTWSEVGPQEVQKVWRTKIRELTGRGAVGHRSAEIVISRLLTVAAWLTSIKRIPPGSCTPPYKWRQALRKDWRDLRRETRDPAPQRPRYTVEEAQALLRVAPLVDPRFNLLLWLGLELRLGQVQRARRTDLDLAAQTFVVHGSGKKRGTTVHLTEGQLAVATHALTLGYLSPLEREGGDFPLFPAGQLSGGRKGIAPHCRPEHRHAQAIGDTARRAWLLEAEELAQVPHVEGRGGVGLRRAAVDLAVKRVKLDPDALQKFGGWLDSQMPMQVYRDQEEDAAARRATTARAELRGEAPPNVAKNVATPAGAESGEVAK